MGARRGRGTSSRILGDLFLERKRLEVRMGENISDRVGDIERNPHSGSRFNIRSDRFNSLTSPTIRSHPRGRLSFSAFAPRGS